jgi:hypothetical protein
VLFFYCQINATTTSQETITWTRDGATLKHDVPHIRIRASTSSANFTSLLLVVDSFQDADSGVYQCISTVQGYASGFTLNVTGMSVVSLDHVDVHAHAAQ